MALAARAARSRSGRAPARAAPGRPSGRRSASRRAAPPPPCRSGRARCRSRGGRAARSRSSGRSPTSRSDHGVLLGHPVGGVGVGQVGQRARRPGRAPPRPRSSSALPASICSFRPCAPRRSASSASSPALLGLADLLRRASCARAWRVLDLGQQLAAAGVEREQLVDARSAAPRRASAALTRSGSERISFRSSIGRARSGRGSLPGRGRFFALRRPAYLATKRATCFGLLADDDVLGHDRAGEAAVLDREERVVVGLGSLVEVRALGALAAVAGALGAGGAQRVAAGAVGRRRAPPRCSWGRPWRPRCLPRRSRRRRGRGRRRATMAVTRAGRTRRASYCLLEPAPIARRCAAPTRPSFRAAMGMLPTGRHGRHAPAAPRARPARPPTRSARSRSSRC